MGAEILRPFWPARSTPFPLRLKYGPKSQLVGARIDRCKFLSVGRQDSIQDASLVGAVNAIEQFPGRV